MSEQKRFELHALHWNSQNNAFKIYFKKLQKTVQKKSDL